MNAPLVTRNPRTGKFGRVNPLYVARVARCSLAKRETESQLAALAARYAAGRI
jgi:hypothetical protein